MNIVCIRRLSSPEVYLWVGFACLACLSMSGCFTGEYERRMQETIKELETGSKKAGAVFATASGIVDAAGTSTGISLRLPVFVDANAKSLVAGQPNAQPPFFDMPGFAYSYEIPFESESAYVHVAAVKAGEKPADQLAQEVQAAVSKTFSGAAWQDVTLETFSGGSMSVKRLRAVGPQTFGGSKADGQFDLYLLSSSSHHVLIGWRASAAADQAHGVFEKAAISMGTVEGAS